MSTKTGVYPVYENQFQVGADKENLTEIADMETFSVKLDNGVEEWNPFDHKGWVRRLMTSKSVTFPDGATLLFENAVYNVTNWGAGKSTEVIPLEFDVMSNGKPTYTEATIVVNTLSEQSSNTIQSNLTKETANNKTTASK